MDLTHDKLSSTIELSELDQNFADVAAALANLSSQDIARRAGVNEQQFANSFQDNVYVLGARAEAFIAGWPATGTVVDTVPFLYPQNFVSAMVQVAWVCTDGGNGTGGWELVVTGPQTAESESIISGVITVGGGADTADSVLVANETYYENAIGGGSLEVLRPPSTGAVGELQLKSTLAQNTTLTAPGSFLRMTVVVRSFLRSA